MVRRATIALLVLILSSGRSIAGYDCPPYVAGPPVSSVPVYEPELATSEGTSLRGLSLGLNRAEALNAVLRLGYAIAPTWSASESHITFCRGDRPIGSLRFNDDNQLITFEVRPAFFELNKVVLREFADSVFEHYRVRPVIEDDAVCYSDITCFKGTTRKGENFVIARIGGEVRLLVSRSQ
jgi:hypothetical protein